MNESDPANEKSSAKKRQAAMPFIMLTIFIDILGIGIIIPILPELVKQFTDSDTEVAGFYYGVIGASYALMQFIFAPIMGALSDRFGRRPIILASLFGLGIDFIIQGCAPSIGWLFVGRVLAGIMGGSITTANAYIADVSTPENRARNYGLVGVMFGLGFICGPALGGVLGQFHLRLPFFVSAGLAFVNFLYGLFILPESLPKDKRSSFSLRKANPFGAIQQIRAYPFVAGIAIAFVAMSLAQRGLENVWVLYTGYRYGWNEITNGLTLALVGFMAALVQGGLVRTAVKRLGERSTVLLGIVVSAFAFLGYGFASSGWMIPGIIVFGSIGGLAGPAIQSLVAGSVSPQDQGKVQGALTSMVSLTNIIAPLFFTTWLFSYFISEEAPVHFPGIPFVVGAGLIVFALFVVVVVFRRFPPQSEDAPENDHQSGKSTDVNQQDLDSDLEDPTKDARSES